MNKHIEEYLDFYISLDSAPYYAVMLRGKWGSGKSWFIKNFIDKNHKYKFLYVSLYGIVSYNEIEDVFFQQLHPLLASKGMKLAGKILKGLIKTTIKVDLDRDGKDDGNISSNIPDITIPEYLNNIDDTILVFDDLERCSITISNIMGYINQFVENNGQKVILLANEDEIIKLDQIDNCKDTTQSYLTIKEKLIGKSFDINTDFDSAIREFILQTNNLEVQNLLFNKKYLLNDLFIISGYNNLRHLRQSILDFERFFNLLPIIIKDELLEHIFKLFFSLSFEIRKGAITEDEIREIFLIDYFSNKESNEKTSAEKIINKYPIFSNYYHPVSWNLWISFFKKGIIDKEELKLSIENSIYYQQENTPNWIKLWHYYDLEDEEFHTVLELVFKQFINLEIYEKYELIHIVGLLMLFSEKKIIPNNKKYLFKLAQANVKNIRKSGKLNVDKYEDFTSIGSNGLSYQGNNIQEFREFMKFITEESNIAMLESYPKIALEMLGLLKKSVNDFGEKLTLSNNRENLYFDIPILTFIEPKEFVRTVLELPNKGKKHLGWALEKRYQFPEINLKLKDELLWLKKVIKLLKKESLKRKRKISGNILETVILISLSNGIQRLEE